RDVVKFFDFWGLERELVAGAAEGFFGPVSRWGIAGLALVSFGGYAMAMFLAIFGFVLRPLDNRRLHWFFLFVVLFICGAHTVVFGHSRYHLPLMPLVLVYSTRALLDLRGVLRQRRRASFAASAVLCLVLVGGWTWGLLAGDWERWCGMVGL